MQFLLYLQPPVSFFIVSAITTFLSLVGLYLVRRKYSAEVLKDNHEVDAIIFHAFRLYCEGLRCLNNLAQYRRMRIFDGNDTVPPVIWFVLLVGGVFAVSYAFFFGMKNIRAQYLITTTLTVTVTSILYLVYVLDHPFTGTSRVSLEPLTQATAAMQGDSAGE